MLSTWVRKYKGNGIEGLKNKIKSGNPLAKIYSKKKLDNREEELEYDLDNANETINELEDKVSTLQETLNCFKELWRKFIEFLQNKFFSSNKYDDFINDLYDEEILDDNDLKFIENNKNNEKSDCFKR